MKGFRSYPNRRCLKLPPSVLHGTPISPGYAQGLAHVQSDLILAIDDIQANTPFDAEMEFGRLESATATISNDLLELAVRVGKELDSHLAGVFDVHNQIANDHLLKLELRKEIVENFVTAGSAVRSVFMRWEKRFIRMESMISKEKCDDFRDVSIRLRNALSGITSHALENIPEGCVLVIQRLLPSDTIYLNSRSTAAVLLEQGTMGSHAALFARQLGIPCISDIPDIQRVFESGMFVMVDASAGTASINPDRNARAIFHKLARQNSSKMSYAKKHSREPAITQDKILIKVNANIGGCEDSRNALECGADGIGLYRLEQFYIGRSTPPSTDEVREELRETLLPFKGKSICIRLLDLGSDKQLPFIGFRSETNPALGLRGVRLMRRYPELLNTQLQAILQLKDEFDVQILIPMVATEEDVIFVRNALEKQCADLSSPLPKLGAMIETPAAALSASKIAPHVDFMSFGTNDLTQYAFAADRENAEVGDYYNDTSDVIFRLIKLVHRDLPTMPLSICGELAGRDKYASRLIECGIRTLSVAPPLIPAVKKAVRSVQLGKPE